ncbi:protein REVEILLE 3-like isoform X2 [Salvia splendens]|uniref:protein REVEILLE 3-like isoform X2 n=1 Tax=Salvia splendens TaxID=180675 RepID=UPI001C25250D|nr:protein REVEILLE 3-like isoform X2 [Salvia splendens]
MILGDILFSSTVSVHPNPQTGQGFTHFYNFHLSGDPAKAADNNTTSYWSAAAAVDEPGKKVRKPYTITKSRENWTEMEHEKFLEALHLFDRDWKKIGAFVGSKTVIQIRSHAQKHFMKVQKNGASEHVPPPRPKRKAAHPYPHKAPKKVASQPSEPLSSGPLLDPKYAVGLQSVSVPTNIINSKSLNHCTPPVPTGCSSPISSDDFALPGGAMNWSSSSDDVIPGRWESSEMNSHVKEKVIGNRALPDFAQVYCFIGRLYDSSVRDHLTELKKMDPINIKMVLMLMNNLLANLISPEFENHRKLLSLYNVDVENDQTSSETSW